MNARSEYGLGDWGLERRFYSLLPHWLGTWGAKTLGDSIACGMSDIPMVSCTLNIILLGGMQLPPARLCSVGNDKGMVQRSVTREILIGLENHFIWEDQRLSANLAAAHLPVRQVQVFASHRTEQKQQMLQPLQATHLLAKINQQQKWESYLVKMQETQILLQWNGTSGISSVSSNAIQLFLSFKFYVYCT